MDYTYRNLVVKSLLNPPSLQAEHKLTFVQIASPPESQSSGQDSDGEVESTRLSYIVEVSPQRWMPVRLIEGRISKEIGNNLRSIKEEALKRC